MLLTERRKEKGWSKSELARQAGLNQTTVVGIENKRLVPYDSQLRKLARALGVPEDKAGDLLSEEGTTAHQEAMPL